MIDTHNHLYFASFDEDRGTLVADLINPQSDHFLDALISVGVSIDTCQQSLALAQQYARIYSTVGIHPHEAILGEGSSASWEQVIEILNGMVGEEVVAVGECGLDYSDPVPGEVTRSAQDQKKLFEQQIVLAQKRDLPLVVHSRDAFKDTLEILRAYPKVRAVWHCFTYNTTQAAQVLDRGDLISFTGILTFKNAQELRKVAGYVPLDRVMAETDAPFVAPEPFRGKRCEPWMVKYVVKTIADVQGRSMQEVEKLLDKNARGFFSFDI